MNAGLSPQDNVLPLHENPEPDGFGTGDLPTGMALTDMPGGSKNQSVSRVSMGLTGRRDFRVGHQIHSRVVTNCFSGIRSQ